MSKVSVTGSKRVMPEVIEAVYALNEVHLSDYDGSWAAFDNGDPIAGADEASERLVTVRALESTLDIDREEVEPEPGVEDREARLERVRSRVNELDDERTELRDERRRVEDRLDRIEPFADLGIDLDLLSGYRSVEVGVVSGPEAEIEAALAESEEIRAYETFTGGDVVAIVAAPAEGYSVGDGVIDDALVGVDLTRHELPDTDRSPEAYADELDARRRELDAELEDVEARLEQVAREEGSFLVGLERRLTMEVQQAEAPLQFATTDRAFVAEGWIRTKQYDTLVAAVTDAVGESVEIEELERADYDDHGHPTHTEEVDHDDGDGNGGSGPDSEEPAADDSEREPARAATDGGQARAGGDIVTIDDEPPVVQDNTRAAKPFEFLLQMIARPKYSELDPTFFLLLTFPAFFGFMLGDLGYGLLYGTVGFLLYSRFDDDVVRSLGAIGLWAGGFTMLFGILYGEVFGMHVLGDVLFGGSPPMHKGLQPAYAEYSQTWLMVSVLLGLAHLTLGYVLGFINDMKHGVAESYLEHGSWALLMLGFWTWVFSRHTSGVKPDFLYEALGSGSGAAYELGYTGLPADVGLYVGVPVAVIGLVTMIYGEVKHYGGLGIIIGLLESFSVLGDVLSYLRIAAVILAKAGMAFVVNMLFFGVYVDDHGGWHFGTGGMPDSEAVGALEAGETVAYHGYEVTEIMFGGLLHGGLLSAAVGVVVLVVGHIVVLLLGVTSAGLQGIRLEYVEFFEKFYEGGGRKFEPFGHGSADGEE